MKEESQNYLNKNILNIISALYDSCSDNILLQHKSAESQVLFKKLVDFKITNTYGFVEMANKLQTKICHIDLYDRILIQCAAQYLNDRNLQQALQKP